jgi:hypothetical protein
MRTSYEPAYQPAIDQIRAAFTDEITSLGGTITEVFDDGHRLVVRAVLGPGAELRPLDKVTSGVAIRVVGSEIVVHPYVLRQVCTNGAIIVHAVESRRFERTESSEVVSSTYESAATLRDVEEAVRACASESAFNATIEAMRTAMTMDADVMWLFSALTNLPETAQATVLPEILDRLRGGGDPSAFGLMNAVTSVARDTDDPGTRWALEAMGGSIPARPRRPSAASAISAGSRVVE